MSDTNETPIDVDERLGEITFKLNQKLTADELVALIEDAKNKHLKLRWTGLKLGLERRNKEEIDIVIFGVRAEEPAETKSRIAEAKMKQKYLEEQEVKEYLRLKRKYENKNEN